MAVKTGGYVSASELADFVYCERSWRLGAENFDRGLSAGVLERGTRWHEANGRMVFLSRRVSLMGVAIMACGIIIFLVAGAALLFFGKVR